MQVRQIKRLILILAIITLTLASAQQAFATAPNPPTGLNVQADAAPGTNINITWIGSAGTIDHYNIYRWYSPITVINSDYYVAFVNGGLTNYIDSDTIPGETYYYQITAVNNAGEESGLSTGIISDTATASGKLKPHMGPAFSVGGGVCKFCHKIHRAQASKKVLRKLTEIQVCFTCHDGTGSDFNIKIDFDLPTTAHNTELQGNNSANIKCLNCHHPHGKPPNPRMTHELEENLCFLCHRTGGQSGEGVAYPTAPKVKDVFLATDILNDLVLGKIYAHPVRAFTSRHTTSFDENANNGSGYWGMTAATRHVECTDCHNQHKASRIGTTVLGPLEGAPGVIVNNGTDVGAPTFSWTYTITSQYQMCFKCHSSFNPSWNGTPFWDNGETASQSLKRGDKARELNTNNSAYHPVEGAGRNKSQRLDNQLIGALDTNSIIKCSECHNNNDSAGARGPHGSTYQSIRKANYFTNISGPSNWSSTNFDLCFTCHDVSKLVTSQDPGANSPTASGAQTNFLDDNSAGEGKDNLHKVHLVDRIDKSRATCKNCHFNPHSNQQAPNTQWRIVNGPYAGLYSYDAVADSGGPPKQADTRLINFSPDILPYGGRAKPEWYWNTSTRQRRCYLQCHAPENAIMADGSSGSKKAYYVPNSSGDIPAP